MNAHDGVVVGLGAAAATHDWWVGIFSGLPDIASFCITSGSLVFVTFRAINEIRKFLRDRQDRTGDSE